MLVVPAGRYTGECQWIPQVCELTRQGDVHDTQENKHAKKDMSNCVLLKVLLPCETFLSVFIVTFRLRWRCSGLVLSCLLSDLKCILDKVCSPFQPSV